MIESKLQYPIPCYLSNSHRDSLGLEFELFLLIEVPHFISLFLIYPIKLYIILTLTDKANPVISAQIDEAFIVAIFDIVHMVLERASLDLYFAGIDEYYEDIVVGTSV